MPIYEYTCKSCQTKFEKLVKSMSSGQGIDCPKCGSTRTARSMSVFSVGSESSARSSSAAPTCGRCGGPGPCAMN